MREANMSDRRGEIPRMIEILNIQKGWKSLTFFQYKGGNADLRSPLTKIRVAKSRVGKKAAVFSVTIGRLNYAEEKYVQKFKAEQASIGGDKGCWPDDFYETYPTKRKAA